MIISLSDLGLVFFFLESLRENMRQTWWLRGSVGNPSLHQGTGNVGFLSFIWIAGVHTTKLVSSEYLWTICNVGGFD